MKRNVSLFSESLPFLLYDPDMPLNRVDDHVQWILILIQYVAQFALPESLSLNQLLLLVIPNLDHQEQDQPMFLQISIDPLVVASFTPHYSLQN